jgi:D-alanyl-D-alanine carboxypeptidase
MIRFAPSVCIALLLGAASAAWAQPGATAPSAAKTPASVEESLRTTLSTWIRERQVPGATAAVILDDGTLVTVAAGLARKEPATPMKPTDRMFSGSIGKTYYAAVALQLVEEEKLKLDEPIKTYIGAEEWFARLPNAGDITVRQLMNHTSGVPEHVQSAEFRDALKAEPQKTWKPVELAAFVFDKPALFKAGEEGKWSYADTNFIILGIVAEKVIGGPIDAEVKRRLLDKLELTDTERADRPDLPRLISGYAGPGNPFTDREEVASNGRYFMNPQFEWCGGGFITTSADLAKWARALYAGDVLKPETREQMLDAVPAKTGPGDKYGLGVQVLTLPCGEAIGHSGWFPGYVSFMAYFPEKKLAIGVQLNTDAPSKMGRLRALVCELVEAAGK